MTKLVFRHSRLCDPAAIQIPAGIPPLRQERPIAMDNRSAAAPALDVITIGRSSVDLYGQQIGGRLEDMAASPKSVGGCPTNIAIGAARLGLKSALITRVGDEQMGRFIREQLEREGVATRGVVTDPERLTALVLSRSRTTRRFPLIFYRENCADMALTEADIDAAFIASARAVLVTGTHFSQARTPRPRSARRSASRGQNGRKVVFDIDYRPNLWGLAGHAAGDERFVASDAVSARLQHVLAAATSSSAPRRNSTSPPATTDTLAALQAIRALSPATIVCKRGPMGCSSLTGRSPTISRTASSARASRSRSSTCSAPATPSCPGFLRGWLRGEPHATSRDMGQCLRRLRRSRGCSARRRYRPWTELQFFLEQWQSVQGAAQGRGARAHPLGDDPARRLARADGARHRPPRASSRRWPREAGADDDRIGAFKRLAVAAAARVAGGAAGLRHPLDGSYGREALFAAAPSTASGSAARSSAGLAAAALRVLAGRRLAAGRMAGRPCRQVPVLLSSRRRAGAEARAEREAPHALRGGAQGRPRTAARDHRRQARPRSTTTPSPARSAELYDAGHQSRLVEARAAGVSRRVAAHRRVIRDERPIVPRHRPARPGGAGSAGGRRFAAAQRRADGQGLRGRPHDLRRCRQAWLAGRMSDEEAIADMARALTP